MKKYFFLLFFAVQLAGYCQTDTIMPCQRHEKFMYDSSWADSFSQHCQGRCDIRGSVWEALDAPAIVLRQCHSDSTILIAGIAAPIFIDTFVHYSNSNRLPEYFYLYAPTDSGLTELASVRWDTATPDKTMMFYGVPLHGYDDYYPERNMLYADSIWGEPVYEAYFYKPIAMNGTFYVGGSTNNNYRATGFIMAHPCTRYLRWSIKYLYSTLECRNGLPRAIDTDLIMYNNETIGDTAFHINPLIWPGFGCIFPIFATADDTIVTSVDTCRAASGLRVLDNSERNVTLGWVDNGNGTTWELSIVKGDTATAQPENGVVNSYNTNMAVLYGLDTAWYTVYIRTVCSEHQRSLWSEPIHFNVTENGLEPNDISLADYYTLATPNPTNGKVNIFSSFLIKNITVSTVEGRVVMREKTDSHSMVLDLAAFPAGTYYIQIQTSRGMVTKKVIRN